MATREKPTAADFLVAALSPVLIMFLVGSLILFLAEVFYVGQYSGRLQYTLCFFVFGSVLANRIAVVVDRKRAWAYSLILAIVTYIALNIWIEFPEGSPMAPYKVIINLVLILIVWWSSNRLIWDCTYLDEKRTGSGQGLLARLGWEKRPQIRPDVVDDLTEDEKQYSQGLGGWYERYFSWRKAESKKPHAPGTTVLYFTIAALPIFGLGQALIPADSPGRRAFTFWCAAVYIIASLSLLMTTSFLGLRRYLRQKKLPMPMSMTAKWFGLGIMMVLAFVLAASLLPRPYSETPIWDPTRVASKERNASQNAINQEGGAKGEGKAGNQSTKGDGNQTGKNGQPGAKGDGDSKSGSGDKQGKNSSDSAEKKGDGSQGKDPGRDQNQDRNGQQSDRQANEKNPDGQNGKQSAADRLQNSQVGNALSKVANVLKWIIFAVVALVVVFMIFRHGLKFLSNFMPWAKSLLASIDAWWKGLFAKKEKSPRSTNTTVVAAAAIEKELPTFAEYPNPFDDGSSGRRSSEELARYSFEALEAWARGQGAPRGQHETASEFSARLGADFPDLAQDAQALTNLLARILYAPGALPPNSKKIIERFWTSISEAATVKA